MVPDDERVQNIMQIRMQSPGGKLDALLPRALNICMKATDVRQFAYAMAHKDAAFLDQCKSTDQSAATEASKEELIVSEPVKTVPGQPQTVNPQDIQKPVNKELEDKFVAVCSKLIDVEMMMREDDDEDCKKYSPDQI